MGILDKLKHALGATYHGISPFDNGQGWTNTAPKPAPTPPPGQAPRPSIISRIGHDITHNPVTNVVGNDFAKPVYHFALPTAHFIGGLANAGYRISKIPVETARMATADVTNNPAAQQATLNRVRPDFTALRNLAQGVPRFAYGLGESLNPAGGDVYQRTHAPSNRVEQFLFGKDAIPSWQMTYKQSAADKGKAYAGGEAVLNSLLAAAPAAKLAPKAAEVGADVAAKASPAAAIADHPAVRAINDHLDMLNKANDNLTAQGLSPRSAPKIANAKAYKAALQERTNIIKSITEGGYVRMPGGKSTDAAPAGETPPAPRSRGSAKATSDQTSLSQSSPKEVPQLSETVKGKSAQSATIQKAPNISPETKANLRGMTYNIRPQSDLIAKATAAINKDLNAATEKTLRDLNQTPGRLTDAQFVQATKVAEAQAAKGNVALEEAIYRKLQPHGTRTAQSLAARQVLSNLSPQGMKYKAQTVLEKAGVTFEGKVRNDVNAAIDEVKSTTKGTDARQIAEQKLADTVNNYIPRSKMQATIDFWRAGLLTGPETVAKVATSHAIVTPLELGVRPLAAATDAVVAHLPKNVLEYLTRNERGATPGARTVTFSPTDYAKGVKGGVEGTQAAYTHLKTGIDLPNTGGFEKALGTGHHQTPFESMVYRVHGTVYKGPFRMAYRIEEANQLRLAKTLFGDDAKKIADHMTSPKVVKAMDDYAKQFAMQNKTEAGTLAQTIQHFKPGGVPIGEWLAPFSRIPAAIGVKGIVDYTPIGTVRAIKTLYDGIAKGTFDQRKFSESLSKSAVGGTAVVGTGAWLMANGRMTLQEPADPKERQLWLAQGKQRNSIKIGGKWISLNAMGPLGIALGMGGAWQRANSGGDPNAVAQAVGAGAKLLADQPYMKGVTGVGNVLADPVRYAESYLRNSATSFIPAGVQQVARGSDKSARAYPDTFAGAVKQAFPGLRETTPASHDIFGATVAGNAATSGRVGGIVNPFYPMQSKNQNDAPTKELQRLYDALGSKSVATQPTTNYTVTNPDGSIKKVSLTTKQQQDMIAAVGPPIHDAIAAVIKNPSYQALNDLDKVSKLNDIINAYQAQYMKANINPDQKVTSTQTKLMTSDLASLNLAKKTSSSSNKSKSTTKKTKKAKVAKAKKPKVVAYNPPNTTSTYAALARLVNSAQVKHSTRIPISPVRLRTYNVRKA